MMGCTSISLASCCSTPLSLCKLFPAGFGWRGVTSPQGSQKFSHVPPANKVSVCFQLLTGCLTVCGHFSQSKWAFPERSLRVEGGLSQVCVLSASLLLTGGDAAQQVQAVRAGLPKVPEMCQQFQFTRVLHLCIVTSHKREGATDYLLASVGAAGVSTLHLELQLFQYSILGPDGKQSTENERLGTALR